MDYEKKYKEALERAREELGSGCFDKGTVEYIFPELKESEDERIRKEFCKDIWTYIPNEKAHKYIAWLKKQVSKSSFDEHKQEGDRIVTNSDGTRFNLSQLERVAKKESASNEEERIREDIITYMRIANKILPQLSIERWIAWLEKQNKPKWTEEDEKCIYNCCLLIGAADDCYEKTFKDDCIHYLQSLKERISWKPMPIKQKDIDDLVFNFKWSNENFKNKRVTDIYRQGIYDVMELLKQRIEK